MILSSPKAFIKANFEWDLFKYSDRSGTPSVDFEDKVQQSELEANHELLGYWNINLMHQTKC